MGREDWRLARAALAFAFLLRATRDANGVCAVDGATGVALPVDDAEGGGEDGEGGVTANGEVEGGDEKGGERESEEEEGDPAARGMGQ